MNPLAAPATARRVSGVACSTSSTSYTRARGNCALPACRDPATRRGVSSCSPCSSPCFRAPMRPVTTKRVGNEPVIACRVRCQSLPMVDGGSSMVHVAAHVLGYCVLAGSLLRCDAVPYLHVRLRMPRCRPNSLICYSSVPGLGPHRAAPTTFRRSESPAPPPRLLRTPRSTGRPVPFSPVPAPSSPARHRRTSPGTPQERAADHQDPQEQIRRRALHDGPLQ